MEIKTEIASKLLENQVTVTVITVITVAKYIFNYLNKSIINYNQKKDKARYKKVRYISEEIVKTKFGGAGNRNIDKYLLGLESVLDLSGKQNQYDYTHDGHIWKVIEDIKKSSTEKEFEKNKQILMKYLTLEKNKRNQKQSLKANARVLSIALDLIIGFTYIYYFYFIFDIRNIMFILSVAIMIILLCTLSILHFRENIEFEEKNIVFYRKIRGRKIVVLAKIISVASCILGVMLTNYAALSIYASGVTVQNMLFGEDKETIYIYTEQKVKLFEDLKDSVEKETGKKVEFVSEKKDLPAMDKDAQIGQIVEKKLTDMTSEISYMIWLIIGIMMLIISSNMMKKKDELKVYTDEIRMTNYIYNEPYQEKIKIADEFISRAEQYSGKERKSHRKDINKYLETAFWILEEQKWGLEKTIKKQEKMLENMTEYEELKSLDENLESVKEKMKGVKRLFL